MLLGFVVLRTIISILVLFQLSIATRRDIQVLKDLGSNQTEPLTSKLGKLHCSCDAAQSCWFLLSSEYCLSSPLL